MLLLGPTFMVEVASSPGLHLPRHRPALKILLLSLEGGAGASLPAFPAHPGYEFESQVCRYSPGE